MQKFILTLSLFLSLSNFSFSQKEWTLQECIAYGLHHNIQVQQQMLGTRMNENNYFQSKMALLPNLNFSANHNYSEGRTVDPYTNEFSANIIRNDNFSLNSSLTLFNGFSMLNAMKQQKLLWQAGQSDIEKTKNDISLNIATAYFQVLYNIENRDINIEQVQINNEQVNKTQKLLDAGSVAEGNLLDAKAQLANAKLQLANAENQVSMSLLTLKQLMNLDSETNITIFKPVMDDFSNNILLMHVDSIFQEALQVLPEMQAAQLKLEADEAALHAARGGMSPRIYLSGSYNTGYSDARTTGTYQPTVAPIGYLPSTGETVYGNSFTYVSEKYPFNNQIHDNASKSISIGMSLPIFNNFQTQTQISNAKISFYNARLSLTNTRQQIYKNIQQAYFDALAAYKKFQAATQSLLAQKKSFAYMQKKFNLGIINVYDYNASKNNLFKAKSDLLQAKYEYFFKINILDFYRGKPLTF